MIQRRQTDLFCEWLENYLDYERIKKKEEFSLETMQFLVNRFHHPERSFRSIHVAGSKGKGSVSMMLSCILEASGLRTGLYASPHLIDFTERITRSGSPFPDEVYGRACDIVVHLVESIIPEPLPSGADPSWFELVTLLAMVTFKEAGLDWAVIETGLGGRLDATNVVEPQACVITPIELEHTEYLGNTIEKIAGEKAGIIKEGIPVFLAEQRNESRRVFELAAERKESSLFSMDDAVREIRSELSVDGLSVDILFNRLPGGAVFSRPLRTKLSLVSGIQANNAALAAYTVKTLFPGISEETIEEGLSKAWLPGRFEILRGAPPVVLDGAHTVRSVTLTVDTFSRLFGGEAHLLFACAADKNVDSIAALFGGRFSKITVTRPGEKKVSDIDHAAAAFTRIFGDSDTELEISADYVQAIPAAFRGARMAAVPLLVTGSFYLVAEVKKRLEVLYRDQGN